MATPIVIPENGIGGSGLSDILEAANSLLRPITCVEGLKSIGLVTACPSLCLVELRVGELRRVLMKVPAKRLTFVVDDCQEGYISQGRCVVQ